MNYLKKIFKYICSIFIINILIFNICNTVEANEVSTTSLDSSIDDIINLSIGSINIEKFEANQEISIPITIENAKSLCAGNLYIEYFGNLTYMGIENKNSNFTFAAQENIEDSIIVINFSSASENEGDINLVNLKFKLPKEVKDEQTYALQFTDETSLTTLDIAKYKYEMNNGKIYIKEGNAFSYTNIFKIGGGISIGFIIFGSVIFFVRKSKK